MASHNYHRFEAHCYNMASSFQTVWHPLTKDTSSRKDWYCNILVTCRALLKFMSSSLTYCLSISEPMQNMTTRHVYFLTKILQDSLLTQRLDQGIAAMMGLSGRCEKIIELFCLVCFLVNQ